MQMLPSFAAWVVVLGIALCLGVCSPALADTPSLTERSLALDADELAWADGGAVTVTPADTLGIRIGAAHTAPSERDRRRVHRGRVMAGLGVPLLVSGVGALAAAGTLSPTNDCGDRRARSAFALLGVGFIGAGVTFTAAGFARLRRASREARAERRRRTRAMTALAATLGTVLGLGTLAGASVGTALCPT